MIDLREPQTFLIAGEQPASGLMESFAGCSPLTLRDHGSVVRLGTGEEEQ